MNQLKRYHVRPDPFLSTSQHFYDGPNTLEPKKASTMGMMYTGSLYMAKNAQKTTQRSWRDGNLHSTADLDSAPPPRQQLSPSTTGTRTSTSYRGNGTFTVELPHTTIHYRNPGMVPYSQLTWKSEYSDKYVPKKPQPGYSTLSSRWDRPHTTRW